MEDINTLPKCCKLINRHRESFLENRNLPISMPFIELNNIEILSHIRECCDHGYFLDELLSDFPAEFNFSECDARFYSALAFILDNEVHNTPIYEKFWKCMPLLKIMAKNGLKDVYNAEIGIGKVLANCGPLDPEVIVDLIICVNESPFFKILADKSYLTLHLDNKDADKLVEKQEDIPDCIRKIHRNIPKMMKYEEEIINFESIRFEHEITGLNPCLCIVAKEYYCDGYRVNTDDTNLFLMLKVQGQGENMAVDNWDELHFAIYINLLLRDDEGTFENRESVFNMLEDRLNLEDFRRLLYSICNTDIPVYLEDEPIFLRKSATYKSARK